MKTAFVLCLGPVFCLSAIFASLAASQVFVPRSTVLNTDYLIDDSDFVATANRTRDELTLTNGLIKRVWKLEPNAACIGFENLMTDQTILRSVRPESRLTIDGTPWIVGGLVGQPNQAFLTREWIEELKSDPAAMQCFNVVVDKPTAPLEWNQRRHHAPNVTWPPQGVRARFDYHSTKLPGIVVSIYYVLYDHIPVFCKWLSVANHSATNIVVDRFRIEELAAVEHVNMVELRDGVRIPPPDCLHVETDFAFGGMSHPNANRHTVSWRPDPDYATQVNYLKQTPCLLVVEPTYGPAQDIRPNETFESFRTYELVYDSSDRERRGLALRKMYRTLAPWVAENPITHHLLSADPDAVRKAIDEAAAVGFEAIILSFGSGFNMESTDADYLEQWKAVADAAHAKGIEIGAYSLFSSRSVGNGNDVVSPAGQHPAFGHAPAATSEWGIAYFAKLRRFFEVTGFDQFENDGPYPGDLDITSRPPYQKGVDDSRWAQWKIVSEFYRHLRAAGVYINQPDYYFLSGGNKTGMGYREVNWSLPRTQQVIHTRQNIYDGTWEKTPSMGWMHVPLAPYQGGGAAATVEPLNEHLDHYEQMMKSNLGMGVQAHYRGPRLFDADATRDKVASIVGWFKKYRDILESDIIHGRRSDGRDLDWVLHVNPLLENRGMLCVWNPLSRPVKKTLRVNLYYTGITETAAILSEAGKEELHRLDRDYFIELEVNVDAHAMAWFVIREQKKLNGESP